MSFVSVRFSKSQNVIVKSAGRGGAANKRQCYVSLHPVPADNIEIVYILKDITHPIPTTSKEIVYMLNVTTHPIPTTSIENVTYIYIFNVTTHPSQPLA